MIRNGVNPLSHRDLISASKAIHDSVRESISGDVKALEAELGLRLGKMLENRLDKGLGEEVDRRVKALEDSYRERVDFLAKSCQEGLERLERLIAGMQVPPRVINVIIPEQLPPTVNVRASDVIAPTVQVNIPELVLPPAIAHFTLPDLNFPTPIVNVAAAEMKALPAPVVNVSTPRRRVTKNITYDERSGRPVMIEETEEEV